MREPESPAEDNEKELMPVVLQVSADLYRAYQRCTWILVNETGKNRLEIMNEMVRDFLIKHGC
jgi:hypothetical protein